jgi:1-phosphatidylinositol-3-phosphate 5-kinase
VNSPEAHDNIELIGGSFKLNRTCSVDEHASLVRVLRVSVYVLLSLLLEQSFLSNSSIKLHYPKPSSTSISFPLPAPILHRNSSPEVQVEAKQQKRNLFRQGIWSFIHKRLPRSITVNSSEPRDASLDFSPHESDTLARASLDTSPGATQPRQRRFSIFGESRATPPPEPSQTLHDNPFQTALQHVEEGRALLSTSPGLVVPLPQLLVRLAELEKANPTRRLTGEERTGLTSILGWEGKKAALRGSMTGTAGFLRQQQLSLLYSEYVYDPDSVAQSSAPVGSPMKPVDALLKPHKHSGVHVHRVTYMYYGGDDCDQCLGDMITTLCSRAEEPCPQRACKIPQERHERRWSHNGIRVTAKTEPQAPFASPDIRSQEIEMWQSCKICQESTARCNMSDGT